MRIAGLLLVLSAAGPGAAAAQDPPVVPPPVQTPQPQPPPGQAPPSGQLPLVSSPAAPFPAAVPSTLSGGELRRRRDAIDAMEGMLPTKVRSGAKETMREIEAVKPGLNLLTTSAPRARGFHLEGYGVFFYVEIPGVRPSVASIVEQLQRERDRGDRGAAASRAAANGPVAFDPNAMYTDAVKRQLIDALLDYSQPLELRANEWLTIAARDGDEPIPNVIYESITMVLRVRGADLAEFRAGRITREEMLKRVEVRGF